MRGSRFRFFYRFVMFAVVFATFSAIPANAAKSLFDRLGGAKAVGSVTIEFVNVLASDKRLTDNNPAVKDAFASVDALRLKKVLYLLLCEVTGGPCKYKGKSMPAAHEGLKINEIEWFYMLEDLVKVLDKFNVPEQEKNEVLAIIATTKKDIVGK